MIPPDVASSLRLVIPDQHALPNAQSQPVAPAQQVADVLSNLVPGQRILAEIQALLPNGSYRAVVAQRDVTLALPFSAKPGDTLELEVTESDGKLTLAFVTSRSDGATAKAGADSVATSLSPAGKLIGNLMAGIEADGKRAPAAPLNGSEPLVEAMPKTAADLAPVLKQAVAQSGLFYEAHQARWVAGELPTEALRQEPQGKYPATQLASQTASAEPELTLDNPAVRDLSLKQAVKQREQIHDANQARDVAEELPMEAFRKESQGKYSAIQPAMPNTLWSANQTVSGQSDVMVANPLPRELIPLVQQQLDGLASQNFAWQGQVWPGQQMHWEIGRDLDDSRAAAGEEAQRWQTRLKLSLPALGNIDVAMNLRPGGQVGIAVTAQSEASEALLREASSALRSQFEAAGLKLSDLLVQRDQAPE